MHQHLQAPDQVLPDAAPAPPAVNPSPNSPAGTSAPAAPAPDSNASADDSGPMRRKSVSLPSRADAPSHHSAAHEKLIARKPTPFNTGLAETIKKAGINAALLDNIDDLDDEELERLDNLPLDDSLASASASIFPANGKPQPTSAQSPISDALPARPQGPPSS